MVATASDPVMEGRTEAPGPVVQVEFGIMS